jgi:hypothetical protein
MGAERDGGLGGGSLRGGGLSLRGGGLSLRDGGLSLCGLPDLGVFHVQASGESEEIDVLHIDGCTVAREVEVRQPGAGEQVSAFERPSIRLVVLHMEAAGGDAR